MRNAAQKKFNLILKHETERAYRIARLSLGRKEIGVWEVLIPLIFIFNTVLQRQREELFVKNILFTKNLALKAALSIKIEDKSLQSAMLTIRRETDKIIFSDNATLYSKAIQTCQIEEIELLIDHYLLLLKTKGQKYTELIHNAYPAKEAYHMFLNKLTEAENAVGRAAKQTLGARADVQLLERLQDITIHTRQAEADRIFAPVQ